MCTGTKIPDVDGVVIVEDGGVVVYVVAVGGVSVSSIDVVIIGFGLAGAAARVVVICVVAGGGCFVDVVVRVVGVGVVVGVASGNCSIHWAGNVDE